MRELTNHPSAGTDGARGTLPQRPAFTLIELLVVIGIMVLLLAMAVPAFNYMTGSRSTATVQNQLSALLAQARIEAIYRANDDNISAVGVAVYTDQATGRTTAAIVAADRSSPANVDFLKTPDGSTLAYDPQFFPPAMSVRMLGSGTPKYIPTAFPSSGSPIPIGVILFDRQGRLVSMQYAVPWMNNPPTPNLLASRCAGVISGNDAVPGADNRYSQFGFVIFQAEALKNKNYSTAADEATWIDANTDPVMVNRYNGTLLTSQ